MCAPCKQFFSPHLQVLTVGSQGYGRYEYLENNVKHVLEEAESVWNFSLWGNFSFFAFPGVPQVSCERIMLTGIVNTAPHLKKLHLISCLVVKYHILLKRIRQGHPFSPLSLFNHCDKGRKRMRNKTGEEVKLSLICR